MAKAFTQLKDPKLGLQDKLLFGKFKDCRICDIVQDHYEYLIWAEKEGYIKFQPIVIETIQEMASFKAWTPLEISDEITRKRLIKTHGYTNDYFRDMEDDVPF